MSQPSLKSLILCRFYPPSRGGVEVVAEQHASYFVRMGYVVDVLTFGPLDEKSDCKKGRFGEVVWRFRSRLSIAGVHFSFRFFLSAILKGYGVGKNGLIEIHHPSPLDALIGLILYFVFRRKYLMVVHAPIVKKPRGLTKIADWLADIAFRHAYRIIFTSDRLLVNLFPNLKDLPSCRIVSIATEVNFRGTGLGSPSFNNRVLHLAFIGRLVPYKGVDVLIKALVGVEGVRLTIFGDGILQGDLLRQIKQNGLEERISFSDDLSDQKKSELLEQSDVIVLPSVTNAEAFGIVQLEAMSFGKPVINTDLLSGVPSVSLDGVSGLTVPPNDYEQLRKAIIVIRDDCALYQRLSAGAKLRSLEFALDKIYLQFQKALNSSSEEDF